MQWCKHLDLLKGLVGERTFPLTASERLEEHQFFLRIAPPAGVKRELSRDITERPHLVTHGDDHCMSDGGSEAGLQAHPPSLLRPFPRARRPASGFVLGAASRVAVL